MKRAYSLLFSALCLASPAIGQTPGITPLGATGHLTGLSADGNVAITSSSRWQRTGPNTGVFQQLPSTLGPPSASGLSPDGSLIIGAEYYMVPGRRRYLTFWQGGPALVYTHTDYFIPGESSSMTFARVADDGITAAMTILPMNSNLEAYRLTVGGGGGYSLMPLSYLPGYDGARCSGLSGDGTVMIGTCAGDDGTQPTIWRQESGFSPQPLANPVGLTNCFANAISRDGHYAVGGAYAASGYLPLRWTLGPDGTSTVLVLPIPSPFQSTSINDISADGTIMVGFMHNSTTTTAAVWIGEAPAVSLAAYAQSHGLPLPGYSFQSANIITPDGFTIAATSSNNQSYLIVLPRCGSADFNGDGDVGTDSDIDAFFACLAGDCCPTCYSGGADFNGDGDPGTDADIESLFRVLSGGSC